MKIKKEILFNDIQRLLTVFLVITLPFSAFWNGFYIILLILITLGKNLLCKSKNGSESKRAITIVSPLVILILLILLPPIIESDQISYLEKYLPFFAFPFLLIIEPRLFKKNYTIIGKSLIFIILSVFVLCNGFAAKEYFSNSGSITESKNWDNITSKEIDTDSLGFDPFFYVELVRPLDTPAFYVTLFSLWAIILLVKTKREIVNSKTWKLILLVFFSLFIAQLSIRGLILPIGIWLIIEILILLFNNKTRKLGIILITILGLFVTAIFTSFSVIKYRFIDQLENTINNFEESAPNSIKIRLALYSCSWEIFKDSPIIGQGYNKSQSMLWECSSNKIPPPYRKKYNSHNQLLQYLIQVGIIGFFLFLSALIAPLLFKMKDKRIYIYFVILILIACLSETIFARQKGIVFFNLFFVTLISNYVFDDKNFNNHCSIQ